ncbi:MAG: radical SAM protein [Candidatus Pacebacteria bacterium]|nr:radical SAM protein [Candidatus Paceibacterota bacterium]
MTLSTSRLGAATRKSGYCLECGIERGSSMEDKILDRSLTWFEDYTRAHPSVDVLRFKLFGGEPLLCKEMVVRAVSAYHTLCDDLGLTFSLEMTTNGVLLDEDIARQLSKHNWHRVQVTLDGPADIHDTRRVGKGGKPTFEKILTNVRMLLAGGYLPAVDIRMTLDAGTADHLSRLLDTLADLGNSSCIRLSLGITTASFALPLAGMSDERLAEVALETWAYARSLGFEIPDEFMTGPVCVATAKHSTVLQPDGSLQKCFCTSGRSEFNFAHVDVPFVGYTQDHRFEQWKRTDACIDERCPYLPVCGGGCVYEAMVKYGGDAGSGKRLCRKTLLDRMNRGLLALYAIILGMIEQYLPNYTETFRTAQWMVRESPHYRFHYFANSVAEREIDSIVETQEGAYTNILLFLNLPAPDRRISYYLYPDIETKERLMGSAWFAQSVYADFAVHALYSEEHRVIGPHEDTHLLSLPLGLSIGFIQEGLAERMVGHDWFGNLFIDTVREAFHDERFAPSPNLLTSQEAWLDTPDEFARQYYALAALFADYLMSHHDKDTYFKLYTALQRDATLTENVARYQSLIGVNPTELFSAFLGTVQAGK